MVGQTAGHINQDKPLQNVFGWTLRSVAHLWASQMLKQLRYVGALGIFTLAFQGPQPLEQKQTQWGFLLKSSQSHHFLVHVRRVPKLDSDRVITVSKPQRSESLTGYGI